MPKLTESRRPAQGQQHTYSLDPPTEVGCEVSWFINGQRVNLWDKVGGLEVKGFGAAGTMTVEVVEPDHVWHATEVTARIHCPERPVVTVGPMLIGSVIWDPCEQEPCWSAHRRYRELSTTATDAAASLSYLCPATRTGFLVFLAALGIFIPALVAAVLCQTIHLDPILCEALYVALAVATALTLWALSFFLRRLRLFRERMQACRDAQAELGQAYQQMQAACPQECRLPEVTVDCRCR